MSTKNCTPIFAENKSRPVGHVKGDCFYKSIFGSRHMLRSPRAIAFDISSLKAAKQAGALRVQVTDKENKTIYRADIQRIFDNGFKINRGFGEQIALGLSNWITNKSGKASPKQLEFWKDD